MSSDPAIVFVDLELDGFVEPWLPGGRRIWEVGVIRREPDGTERDFQAFVRLEDLPFDPDEPGPDRRRALDVGRFYERHPQVAGDANAPGVRSGREIAERLYELVSDGPMWVGAVPTYDASSVLHLLHTTGVLPSTASDVPWDFRLACVVNLAIGRLRADPYTADVAELSRTLGVDPAGYDRHTALADARWARDLFDALTHR